jgi:hypothetical protein
METLYTAKAVIKALGGAPAVGRMFGIGKTAVYMWGQKNYLPHDTYIGVSEELLKLGKRADLSLWRFKQPAQAAE